MAMARAILAAVAVAAVAAAQLAAAVDHPVGGTGSWDASGAGYDAWAAKQKFVPGDTISFKYASSHDVTEVSKADYDACAATKPVKSYTGGATTVKLAAPGKRYFICSAPGHCAAGMKLEVTVAAAATTPAPAPAPAKTKTKAAHAPAPAKTKAAHAPAPAKSKPRHQQRSVAPAPAAPAPETPAAAAPATDDEMPTVTTPASKTSGATSVVAMLGAKAGMALAAAMALALAM
ncbi:hypothetical protein ACP4OV_011927 [Aristida adscensionis]